MNPETGATNDEKSEKQVPSASTTSVSYEPSLTPPLPSEDLKTLERRAAELLSGMSGLDVTEKDVAKMVKKWAKRFGAECVIPMIEKCRHRERGFGGILEVSDLVKYLDRDAGKMYASVREDSKYLSAAEADERINQQAAEQRRAIADKQEAERQERSTHDPDDQFCACYQCCSEQNPEPKLSGAMAEALTAESV